MDKMRNLDTPKIEETKTLARKNLEKMSKLSKVLYIQEVKFREKLPQFSNPEGLDEDTREYQKHFLNLVEYLESAIATEEDFIEGKMPLNIYLDEKKSLMEKKENFIKQYKDSCNKKVYIETNQIQQQNVGGNK